MGRQEQKERERKQVAKVALHSRIFYPCPKGRTQELPLILLLLGRQQRDEELHVDFGGVGVGESSKYGGCRNQRVVDSLKSSSSLHIQARSLSTQSQTHSDNPVNVIGSVLERMKK